MGIRDPGPLTSCELVKPKGKHFMGRVVTALNTRLLLLFPQTLSGGGQKKMSAQPPRAGQAAQLRREKNAGRFALWAAGRHFQSLGRNVCPWVIQQSFL